MLILLYLLCAVFTVLASKEWNNAIYVSTAKGINDSSCWTLGHGTPCGSLDVALQALITLDFTVIYIYPGVHTLHNVIEISGRSNIAIVGITESDNDVVNPLPTVLCAGVSAKLLVYNSTNVTLQSLSVQNCGDIAITSHDLVSWTTTVEVGGGVIGIHDSDNVILRDLKLKSTSVFTQESLVFEEDCYDVAVTDCLSLYSADTTDIINAVSGQPVIVTVYLDHNCTSSSSSLVVWKNDLIACLDHADKGIVSFNPNGYQPCTNITYQGFSQTPGYPFILYQRTTNSSISIDNVSLVITSPWELVNNALNFEITVDSCSFPFMVNQMQHKCEFKFDDYFCCSDSPPGATAHETSFTLQTCDTCNMQSRFIKSNSSENCLSRDISTSVSNYKQQFYLGYSHIFYDCEGCPSFVSNCTKYNEFDPFNLSTLSFCASGREGRLCGACEPGKGVPINQLNNCIECSQQPLPGIVIFILVQLIPVTIMVLVIIVFGINLNQGFVIAAVYFFQMTGVVYPGLTFNMVESFCGKFTDYSLGDCNYHKYYHYVVPNTIFNWNFIAFLMRYPLCITPHMTPLVAIAFWYLIPTYPILLMVLIYIWIRMYDKGYRCVVKVSRPVHYYIARFWHILGIEASLFQSMTSIYTLSFTQFAATSFQILHPTKWHVWNNTQITGIASFNDGTVDYFGWPHVLLAIIAILILAVFVVVPITFIQLYPFRFFQRFLSYFHLNKPTLVLIMDIFTGPFKSKSEDSFDYRYFAGFYFLLRLIVLTLHYIPYNQGPAILFTQEGLFLTFSGMIMIFRPYKRNIYNFADFFIVVFLAFSNILMLYIHVEYTKITILIFSVLLYAILLTIYLIYPAFESIKGYIERRQQLKKIQLQHKAASIESIADGINQFIVVGNVINQGESDFDMVVDGKNVAFPDRLENPEQYDPRRYTTARCTDNIAGRQLQQPTSSKTSQSVSPHSTDSSTTSSTIMLQDKPLMQRTSIQ